MAVIGSHNEQGAYPAMFFQESQTWACPVAMEAIVYVIGAGGSGSRIGDNSDNSYNGRGGGAGGCAVSRLTLAAQNYTITIGSGGEFGEPNANYFAGSDGGASSFVNSGGTTIPTMTGNGGSGGPVSTSAQNVTTGGGTATGGNLMNNTGGGGGPNTSATAKTSAGGGVNLYGSDCHGTGEVSYFGAGGTPHGGTQSGTQKAYDFTDDGTQEYGYTRKENIAVSYFSQFITHQSGTPLGDASGTAPGTQTGMTGPLAGSKMFLNYSTYNTSAGLFAFNAPFCGGHALNTSAGPSGKVFSCAGGVGAGGGGCMATSGDACSGAGGSGLVMIFPIQLG